MLTERLHAFSLKLPQKLIFLRGFFYEKCSKRATFSIYRGSLENPFYFNFHEGVNTTNVVHTKEGM